MRCFLFLFLSLFLIDSDAQVTIRITSLPANTPADPTLFIAGSFNNWNPGDSGFMFSKSGNNYEIMLPAGTGNAEYKITRGSWSTGEGTATGGQSANRRFTYAANLVIEIQVVGWEGNSGKPSTAISNVKIISNNFFMPQLNRSRRIWIYLPDDYETELTKTYPVMYMHDGQNVFDNATSFSGEWGVDETLNAKEKAGGLKCIVVAIDNGGASRLDEYSAFRNPQYGGGEGNKYCDFIVQTLKPFIDSTYRTKTARESTAIAGSSMGGLISLYAAVKYNNIFSKAGIFSPALWFSDSINDFVSSQQKTADTKFYFVAGVNESSGMVKDIDAVIQSLRTAGFSDDEIKRNIKSDGQHNEAFWKREFGACYDWLFTESPTGLNEKISGGTFLKIFPNPAKDSFSINTSAKKITLTDFKNKHVKRWKNTRAMQSLNIGEIPRGIYFLIIETDDQTCTEKILIE